MKNVAHKQAARIFNAILKSAGREERWQIDVDIYSDSFGTWWLGVTGGVTTHDRMRSATMQLVRSVARIHESANGRWYVTNNWVNYLDERGFSYLSRRAAIAALRDSVFWTHYISGKNRIVKL